MKKLWAQFIYYTNLLRVHWECISLKAKVKELELEIKELKAGAASPK